MNLDRITVGDCLDPFYYKDWQVVIEDSKVTAITKAPAGAATLAGADK